MLIDSEHGHGLGLPDAGPYSPTQIPAPFRALWTPSHNDNDQANYNLLSMGLADSFAGYPQGSFNAEFLDAAGGLMIQNFFDSSEERPQNSSWMPG